MSGTHAATSGAFRYDWERFWIAQTGILDLSDAGFLRDPVDQIFVETGLKQLDALAGFPALALLGEPGIGKSTAMKLEHERLSARADLSSLSHYVDLKISANEDRLYRQIFESPTIAAWKEGGDHLTLHLDSLDEAMLRIETIPHLLAEGIRTLPTDRLSVRIACRTAVWPANTLGQVLKETWGALGLGIFELAPLRRRDVRAAIAVHGIDLDDFMSALFGAHAVPFAIKPLTLKMLLSLYQRDGNLPSSTATLYHQGALALCDEQNASRRDTSRLGQLNASQRLGLAGRIAAATILGRRFAVWTGPEAQTPPEDIAISALAGALEQGEFAAFTATDDNVREVLDTGLFSARGDNRMGWAHQTYGEFLVALYLSEKGVPAATLRKALTHPSGGLFPPLAVVGAWAASLNPEFRVSLIATDPWTLLRGDLSNWALADLAALVSSMLAYVEAGRFYDYFFGIGETYGRLKHPDLAAQLRATITDESLRAITRRMALSITERCELSDLQPELLAMAFDQTEDPMLRAGAIAALRRCGDASVPSQILALLQTGVGADPHTEICGYALDLLWPNHITATQLFSFLVSSDEHYVGSYASFVFDLAETLTTQDLLPALEWATGYVARSNLRADFRDKTLADAIMFRAWEVFEEPTLTGPFLAHMVARLHQHGELCRGTNMKANDAFMERLRTDTARRRQFVLLLCKRQMDRLAAHPYLRNGFVRSEDLAWLLEISPGGTSPVPGLSEESLCSFISFLFSFEDNEQFELVFPVCRRWPRLRAQFAFLIDGVLIDSQEAAQARDLERQMQELNAPMPPAVADLPAEISGLLSRAEAGEWGAWCWLNLLLMLTPESHVICEAGKYFITTMPGWAAADAATKRRILSTAATYLITAESSVETWFGKDTMTLQSNDLSAVRALILLQQESPDDYATIPQAAWEKWAPVIIGLRLPLDNDSSGELRQLLPDALAKAPAAFISAVCKMLHMEKARARAASEHRPPGNVPSFHFLRDLEECWDSEDLKSMLFAEMQASDLLPAEYAALLDALAGARFLPAVEHAVDRLDSLDESSVATANVLLGRAPAAVWPMLWPILAADDALARAVFLHAARNSYHATPFYAGFNPEAIADLYLLMERLFPSVPDRRPASGWVGPLDMIPDLRDGGPRWLAGMGTEESVHALMRLAAARPDLALLPFELSRGEAAMRLKTWAPLTAKEIFALADRPNARLVTSAADLLEVLVAALEKYAAKMHGAQTPVRDLWDRMPGRRILYRPLDENGVSDVIIRFLRQELGGSGIIANREVEVSRRPSAPVGQRTDILVNAVRHGIDGETFDSIAAVIEVKGCWNPEVFTGLKEQLVRDYMVDLSAPVGIFLVGWFDKTDWDPSDSRRRQTPQRPISEVQEQLNQQAASVPEGFRVRAIAMDIRAPGT